VGAVAVFVAESRKNYDEAELLYRKALELAPDDRSNILNYTELLILRRSVTEAKTMLPKLWDTRTDENGKDTAIICFFQNILCKIEGSNDSAGLQRLKFVFEKGFEYTAWNFGPLLESLSSLFSSEDMAFYSAITAAFNDKNKAAGLDVFEIWKQLQPINTAHPWKIWGEG